MSVKILKSCSFAVILIAAALLGGCGKNGKMESITVTPANISVIPGTLVQYQAQGHLSDGATYFLSVVDWGSSDRTIAPIDPAGGFLLTSTSTGTAVITAADPYSSFTGTTSLAVSPLSSLTVTPTSPSMTPGSVYQFTATGTLANGATQNLTTFSTCSWSSSDLAVATVVSMPGIPGTGIVTAGSTTGTAVIQASVLTTDGTGSAITVTGSTTVTVTSVPLASLAFNPSSDLNLLIPLTVSNGTSTVPSTHQYDVTGTYANNTTLDWTTMATWSSSDPAVASVSATGSATAVAVGTTTITVTDPITGIAISSALTVTSP
jgi:Bacterial Ig-like domain (group 2)